MHDYLQPDLSAELYNILDVCSNDEIAPIADILIRSPECMLRRTRAFERHGPEYCHYIEQIGDELYRLAITVLGHTGETRPTFAAMLAGSRKQIGLPAVSDEGVGHYDRLVNVFASQHLLTVSDADRQRIVNEACVSAGKAASGVLSSDAWPPFVSALLHLAYLRRTFADDGRMLPLAPNLPVEDSTSYGTDVETMFAKVDGDKQTLTLAVIPDDNAGWQTIGSGVSVMGHVQPLIEAAQSLIATYQMLRPETLWREGVKNATASIRKPKTRGIEKTLGSVSVAGLLAPAAFFSLANAIAEQQKLEEIEKSLAEIKASLQEISQFQKSERRSVLTGSIRYFQQVASSVLTGELADEVLHGLERHEVDLLRVQDHLTGELREQLQTFSALKKDGWGGGSKYVKALDDTLTTIAATYDELFLAIRARSCAFMLLCAFPGREAGKRARLDDIRSTLTTFSPSGEATMALDRSLREKLRALGSIGTTGMLLDREHAFLERVVAAGTDILENMKSRPQITHEEASALSFDVKLEGGRPVAIRLAGSDAAPQLHAREPI